MSTNKPPIIGYIGLDICRKHFQFQFLLQPSREAIRSGLYHDLLWQSVGHELFTNLLRSASYNDEDWLCGYALSVLLNEMDGFYARGLFRLERILLLMISFLN